MTRFEKQFVKLLKVVISEGSCSGALDCVIEDSGNLDWPGIWDLAKRHHLETIIYNAAKECKRLPDEIRNQMEIAANQMLVRTIRQEYCFEQIEKALKKENIRYAPLKGAILRQDFPDTVFRFMSDLDFYIDVYDRARIRTAMESIGGVFRGTESGDEQFQFYGVLGVEFHGRLLYKKTSSGIENYPEWSFVDETRDRLTEEGYALNLLGHAVNDLAGAGPGIRYILDLWVYKNLHHPQPNWDAVVDRLQSDGIYEAANNLMELAEYLFGSGESTPLKEELAEYVLKGGLHGDYKRGLASQAAGGNAAFKQFFRNRSEFENRYPWLKKYPFLLPFAWGKRALQSIKTHKRVIKRWRKGMNRVSVDEAAEQKLALNRFGL